MRPGRRQELTGLTNVVVAGFGTDGTDGPTDVAGAIVDGKTIQQARKAGLSIENALERHDSYTFFQHVRGHIHDRPNRHQCERHLSNNCHVA